MGFESFQVELHGENVTFQRAKEAVVDLGHVAVDPNSLSVSDSSHFVMNDGEHIVEIEIVESPLKISCRFTLCHPPSIDAVFLGLIKRLMASLGMQATIREDVLPDEEHPFSLEAFGEFARVAARCIVSKRSEWISAFGTDQLAATTNEAFERIILPQCDAVDSAVRSANLH